MYLIGLWYLSSLLPGGIWFILMWGAMHEKELCAKKNKNKTKKIPFKKQLNQKSKYDCTMNAIPWFSNVYEWNNSRQVDMPLELIIQSLISS